MTPSRPALAPDAAAVPPEVRVRMKARVLIGTRIAGEPESELAYYPSDPAAQAGRDALAAELELLRKEVTDRRYGATSAARPW